MPGYDPYLELLGIPPDRRPPSHRELLGVGPDENEVEKIEAAARKRHEYLGNYTISPQEEVAACAKRLLHEVGSALVSLRNLLTSGQSPEEAESPPPAAMPPPLPPAVPVPPPVVTVAAGIPPPVEQGGLVGNAAAAVAAGASPFPVGEPAFVEAVAREGGELVDLGETAIPLPWKRGLARAGELFRGMAAGVRSIPRRLWGIVRRADGLLRSIAGEENTILHGFLRAVAIAVLVPALAYAGLWLFWGLANLRATAAARGEGEASPGSGTVRIEAKPSPEVAAPKTGNEPPLAIAPFDEAKAQEYQRAWSKHLGVPAEATNSIGMKMVLIPAGEFILGSYDSADEKPPHRVRITKSFHLGQHEVTVGQFRNFVADSKYDAGTRWQNAFSGQSDDHPVVYVSWNDAKAFCDWLSKKEAHDYRLPTEAQWEYACRAGTQTKYSFGDDAGGLGEYGWFGGNSQLQTHPVGQKKPNAWGLYDVYGNVWEWCADWYDSAYYGDVRQVGNLPHAPADDPVGPSSGADRAIRGGAWGCFATTTRSARRSGDRPGARRHDLGFRVARDVAPSPLPARPADTGRVRIEMSDPTAKVEVKVDGNLVDSAKVSEAMVLPAGKHDLELTSEEFEPYTKSFTVRGKTLLVLRVRLEPKPAGTPAAPKTSNEPPLAIAPFDEAKAQEHQRAWSKYLGVPVETANSIGMKLVLIPAGEFMMGSPDSDKDARPDEKPQHRVRITKPFWLGAHEVTVGQYRQFVQAARFPADTSWETAFPAQTDDHPVVYVSWNNANAFCKWLSAKEAKTYRLPTEAEWEYACRAGGTSRFCFGESEAGLGEYAWYSGNSGDQTHPVGQKRPNAWGLYDMHGNVWEWCADWLDGGYYAASPADAPTGPRTGGYRVLRGGSWGSSAWGARSASRHGDYPVVRDQLVGFRAARTITSTPLAVRPAASGTVRIELSDPAAKVQVRVDGSVVDAAELKEAMTLPAGDHRLEVAADEFEDYTSSFTVRAGEEHLLRVPLTRKPPLLPTETNSIGMKMVLIPAGEFMMGSPDSDKDAEPDERPQHRVRITKPFWLSAHEVTVGQYRQFVQAAAYRAGTSWESAFPGQTDDHPVVYVSWNDANAFCKWLSAKEGKTYRLPTEAEWEYACRAGGTSRFCFGESEAGLGEYAWYGGNSGGQTHPVGQKRPNAWGLYDVHGNVWEWCADWLDGGYYAASPADDPTGPRTGGYRVLRGGSWSFSAWGSRSAYRIGSHPGIRFHYLGFRAARTP